MARPIGPEIEAQHETLSSTCLTLFKSKARSWTPKPRPAQPPIYTKEVPRLCQGHETESRTGEKDVATVGKEQDFIGLPRLLQLRRHAPEVHSPLESRSRGE